MKKIVIFFALVAFMIVPSLMKGQSQIDKVFEKYAGQEGFTTVNISKEMFQMFQQMGANAKDSSALEIKKMMEQLNGLKVLTYSFDSTKVSKAVAVYNEFAGAYPAASYKELMTINEGREYVKFMTKQDAAGKITEMVMLMKNKTEVAVLSLTGTIDLSMVSKLSKGLNIHGMENLKKIKDHGNK
jgi:hypothetical protein